MKNIVYVCNYILEDLRENRGVSNSFSQAENNKVYSIYKALKLNNCNVTILSQGKVNNKTFKVYKGFISESNKDVRYMDIIDSPILNIVSLIYFLFKEIKRLNSIEKIDYIIFYNYRPESAIPAYFAKKYLGISIILDYEDGYHNLNQMSKFKKYIYKKTEMILKDHIDGAILVTSLLKERINQKFVVVRGIANEKIIRNSNRKKKNDIPIIMYSGGLERERGITVLLDALKFTKAKFKLIISGKGECEADIKNNVDNRILFLGYISHEEVIRNMIQADILINCQLEKDSFGMASFPSKVFEYISTGNLVVSSNVSDLKEFMGNIVRVYKNDSPKELALKIDESINVLKDKIKLESEREIIKKFAEENLPINIGEMICREIIQ